MVIPRNFLLFCIFVFSGWMAICFLSMMGFAEGKVSPVGKNPNILLKTSHLKF
jgi:hypothetical protein